jgi:hypothetical protein
MEAVQTQPTYPRGLDFEQVWAALMENRELLKETDRIVKENALQMKESKAEFNEKLGNYINLFGDFTEYMMAPKLCEKFNELGFNFSRSIRNTRVRDKDNNIFLRLTPCWKITIRL